MARAVTPAEVLEELEHEGAGGGGDAHAATASRGSRHVPANLIDSPQPQASVTLGLLNRKPNSRSPLA